MQATVQAKGLKPGRSGLLTILAVFAVGLALGALAWAAIEEFRSDSGNDAAVSAPAGGVDGHSEGLTNKYAETYVGPGEPNIDSTGRDTLVNPASNVEPGEPNLTGLEYGIVVTVDAYVPPGEQYRLYNGTASEGVIQAHYNDGAGEGIVGGFAVVEPATPKAFHSDGAGEGRLGGFTTDAPELPMARYEEGMGEGWLGSGESVDTGIAQDPVGQPGIGYFA